MKKLWQTSNGSPTKPAQFVERFTVGNDFELDITLLPYDILGSKAHAKGLHKIGVLTQKELERLLSGLDEILNLWEEDRFTIDPAQEDGHTAIEQYLTEQYGDIGKKIHTGRSRNDQVLTAMRLYEKAELEQVLESVKDLAYQFLGFAKDYEFLPMPGYTHTQPAMLSSVGMWAGAFAEMLTLNMNGLKSACEMVDYCPLGSAAGFGVNFDLPREFVSDELGFKAPLTIAMTAQNTRGKIEADVVHALSSVTETITQFASDILLYTSREFNFFEVQSFLTTGSSIMPQKKNVDIAELMRGKQSEMNSLEFQLKQLTYRLTSGYQRDLQLTKEPVLKAFTISKEMIQAAGLLIDNLHPNEQEMRSKCYAELLAADRANELVKQGMPFRDAYHKVAGQLDRLKEEDIDEIIRDRTHLGSTGNLGLEKIEERLKSLSSG